MICPECNADDDRVYRNKGLEGRGYLKRRRVCKACNHRWNTLEINAEELEAIYLLSDLYTETEEYQALLEEDDGSELDPQSPPSAPEEES